MKLRHWLQVICGGLSIIMFIGVIIWSIIRAFQNPDMTYIRLILTYWKEFVLPLGLSIILYAVFMIEKKRRN